MPRQYRLFINLRKLLFGFLLFLTLQVSAQNYYISFEGKGASTNISTVKVENLTTGANLILDGSDILSLTFTSSIDQVWGNHFKLKIYPNPAIDNSTLEFYPRIAGDAKITIFDITGNPIAQVNSYLENSAQYFLLSGLRKGFYLVVVEGNGYKFSGKLICYGKSNATTSIERGTNNIQVTGEKQADEIVKADLATVEMEYSHGQMLEFTGYSGNYTAIVKDAPEESKVITFTFKGVPVITTNAITAISAISAVSGGNIPDEGGCTITARGICWATTPSPTIGDNITSDGTGSGSFTSNITGLQPFTTYHIRAYATNSEGTAYGDDLTFRTLATVPSLTTTSVSGITRTGATSGGNITSDGGSAVTTGGVCWSTSPSPTIAGSHTINGTAIGSFTSSMTGLLAGTTYYVRAYATNSVGTSYGNELSFTTEPVILATISTSEVTSVGTTTAASGGRITNNGDGTITARGICWAETPFPTVNDNITSDGTGSGSFASTVTGLQPATTYHVRAYATNSAGTAYGADLTFTTLPALPSLTTTSVSGITITSATCGGNITSNGGSAVTTSGICWSSSPTPSISGPHTSDGTANGSFTSSINGLLPGTLYYVRAYATNIAGTAYGDILSFTTLATVPSLTTLSVSGITRTGATSGGNITSNGGATVTTSGICWSTSLNPTVMDSHTSDGTSNGSFSSSMTGLLPNTTYYVRAYAINSLGTSYGNPISFTTDPVQIPDIMTNSVNSITSTTAVSGGNITDDGGSAITARGICWATTPLPTLDDNIISVGTGSGSFTSNITGLQPFTTYHVRAYATNSEGTAYGDDLTFRTLATVPSLTTTSVSGITRTGAISGGNITSDGGSAVTTSGICWSTSTNPTVAGSHTNNGTANGSFTSSMTGLLAGTTYYVRAYAANSVGTSYGNELSFTTGPVILATISTSEVTSVRTTTAVSGGNITNDGDGTITARGICWAATPSPTVNDNITSDGTGSGSFTSNVTGLQAVTTYHVRAYATNSAGTAYGDEIIFTTNPVQLPTLTTAAITTVFSTSAVSGGNIMDDGGSTITARGICWGTAPSPTTNDNLTSDGIGSGSFISNLGGLQPLTSYHVRAYATNSQGTAYGSDLTFTTPGTFPTVTTAEITGLTPSSLVCGGNVTDNGGSLVGAKGVCWSTNPNPTINNNKTMDGTGSGSFTSNLTGLIPNTRYYIRAYATNDFGTAYGAEIMSIYVITEINTCKWLNNAPCFLNLSFDDSQSSHLEIANLLSQYGFKGTFYIETNALETDPDLIEVYDNILSYGHEVGSHSVSHADLTSLNEHDLFYEIDSSVSRINRYFNINCTSFAHPYDQSNNYINNIIFNRNLFTRNYSEYFSPERPRFSMNSDTQVNEVTNFIDEQITGNNSCLIAGHGIDGSGYSPNTTEFFIELFSYIESVQENNNVWVTTMSDGALYESLFHEVNLIYQVDQSNHQIRIQFDYPDKPIYNNFNKLLFSFAVNKNSAWSIQNSGIEYYESDTQYIYTIDLKHTNELTLQYVVNDL